MVADIASSRSYAWQPEDLQEGAAFAEPGAESGMLPALSAALGFPMAPLPPLSPLRSDVLRHVPRAAAFERLDWEGLGSAAAEEPENESIRVAARFRPLSTAEERDGGRMSVRFADDGRRCSITDEISERHFYFNNMFQPDSQQADVYTTVAQPIVQGVIDGYNGAIIAYGQTGSGKTHTMLGPGGARSFTKDTGSVDWNEVGIIPRAVQQLVEYATTSDGRVQLRASYVEIYQEHIIDLLASGVGGQTMSTKQQEGSSSPAGVFIREHQDTLYLPEVTETPICSVTEAMVVMRKGNINRHQAETLMNRNSSRSHAAFIVTVTNVTDPMKQKCAQLYLVDLAGSERIDKTGVQGRQLDEAKKINLGLLALGQVIHSLARKLKHIPYRDSKLTQLLRNCLGGNARTLIMVSVSPHSSNASETLSAMRFGSRASLVTNITKANIAEDPWMLKKMLERARADLNELRGHCRVLQAQVAAFQAVGMQPALFPAPPQRQALPDALPSICTPARTGMEYVQSEGGTCSTRASTPMSGSELGPLKNFTEKRLLVWSLLPSLVCPLTRAIMRDPVNAADGWTYERKAVMEHFSRNRGMPHSPVTGQLLPSRLLTPCHVVAQLVKLHVLDLVMSAAPLPPITSLNVWLVREVISFLDGRSLAKAEQAWPFLLSASNQGLAWRRRMVEDFPAVAEASSDDDAARGGQSSGNGDASAMAWRRRYASSWVEARGKGTRHFIAVMPASKGLTLRKK